MGFAVFNLKEPGFGQDEEDLRMEKKLFFPYANTTNEC
jgi:hypothetical protein